MRVTTDQASGPDLIEQQASSFLVSGDAEYPGRRDPQSTSALLERLELRSQSENHGLSIRGWRKQHEAPERRLLLPGPN